MPQNRTNTLTDSQQQLIDQAAQRAAALTDVASKTRGIRELAGAAMACLVCVFGGGMVWQEIRTRPTLEEVRTVVDQSIQRNTQQLVRLIESECK